MYKTDTWQEKTKLFLIILGPILVTQLGMYAMNFFDTVMSGNAGAEDLAGVAIGSSLWVPIFTGINGIMLALSPIVAQLTGADQKQDVPSAVRQGVYLSTLLALVVLIIGSFILNPILNMMELEPEVRTIAKQYLIALSTGIIPLFIYNGLRSFIDALGQTRVTMVITLLSLPFNIIFNYVFIFGKFGLPAYGGVGAGIATSLTYWVTLLFTIFLLVRVRPFSTYSIFSILEKPSLRAWWNQLKIGVPIGFAIFFEVSIFSAVTILMSTYNTNTIAAHQAAINFASFLYMIPLSIAMALTIAVGFEAGGNRREHAKQYSYLGISIAVVLSILCGIAIYVFDDPVARLYNDRPEVIEMTKHFLYYAIFFQLSDAFGAPIQGALRGYKDVNITLIMALVSYWVIGLPSGYLMATYTFFGPAGYWMGLIIGLAAGAIALFARLLYVQRKAPSQTSKSQ
ncbi:MULTISPECIES: MATE family efflux transporter [Pontibacillus]|uniref:Probable multidrug resistance protein NorM n=1 Tax=Pontibacillus chungwhensis TaxID=265426 RepID=A0ABY8V0M9_9BACI|nr:MULTISPECIES: MATE family efflux transporter [Pontibacillus]MCD5324828.1 MATE family efflux transporter [Pontibacillus sp. HN14]WIF98787.1 MATE family efflux transporter [Pontibacillus chungwhensis]